MHRHRMEFPSIRGQSRCLSAFNAVASAAQLVPPLLIFPGKGIHIQYRFTYRLAIKTASPENCLVLLACLAL